MPVLPGYLSSPKQASDLWSPRIFILLGVESFILYILFSFLTIRFNLSHFASDMFVELPARWTNWWWHLPAEVHHVDLLSELLTTNGAERMTWPGFLDVREGLVEVQRTALASSLFHAVTRLVLAQC